MLDDLLGLFGIKGGKFVARAILRAQQLVKFGMNGLGIAMLGALDKERHAPGRECRYRLPVEGSWRKQEPQTDVNNKNQERCWMRSENAEARDELSDGQCNLSFC
jgi:hypothetical protein